MKNSIISFRLRYTRIRILLRLFLPVCSIPEPDSPSESIKVGKSPGVPLHMFINPRRQSVHRDTQHSISFAKNGVKVPYGHKSVLVIDWKQNPRIFFTCPVVSSSHTAGICFPLPRPHRTMKPDKTRPRSPMWPIRTPYFFEILLSSNSEYLSTINAFLLHLSRNAEIYLHKKKKIRLWYK